MLVPGPFQVGVPKGLLWIVSFVFVLLHGGTALADSSGFSGISYFRSDVTVREEATLEVREEIVVRDAASFYKHGFQRDLPISPEGRWDPKDVGARKRDRRIRVEILEVTKDGSPVRYEQGSGYGYAQVRIGERNTPLDSGEHRYVLRYLVDSVLSLGTTTDTLYWNATELSATRRRPRLFSRFIYRPPFLLIALRLSHGSAGAARVGRTGPNRHLSELMTRRTRSLTAQRTSGPGRA